MFNVRLDNISDPWRRIEDTRHARPILAPHTAIVRIGSNRLGRADGKNKIIGRVEAKIRTSKAKRHISICDRWALNRIDALVIGARKDRDKG